MEVTDVGRVKNDMWEWVNGKCLKQNRMSEISLESVGSSS